MKFLVSILLATSLSVQANQTTIDSIEQAGMTLNSTELAAIAKQYDGYEQALANYRLSITQNLLGLSAQANNNLDLAITTLETFTKQQPTEDEAWVLLAQVYGLKIAYQPKQAMLFSTKAEQALNKGLALNNENPRAYLVKGISAFNTPTIFGGSKIEALSTLNRAIELFADDVSTSSWGNAEAYIWRGLTHLTTNNKAQALADFQSALAIAPRYEWATMLLEKNQ